MASIVTVSIHIGGGGLEAGVGELGSGRIIWQMEINMDI